MSDPVTATPDARYEGFATVTDTGPRGMITVRGEGETLVKAAKAAGVDLPDTRAVTAKGGVQLAWMSPDELLVICDYPEAPAIAAKVEKALGKDHSLVAVVSDARQVFRVEGANADEVLRKVTPANIDALAPGEMRRTRLAQVAGAIWMPEAGVYEVMCFRSVGRYMFDLLSGAARPGSELGL